MPKNTVADHRRIDRPGIFISNRCVLKASRPTQTLVPIMTVLQYGRCLGLQEGKEIFNHFHLSDPIVRCYKPQWASPISADTCIPLLLLRYIYIYIYMKRLTTVSSSTSGIEVRTTEVQIWSNNLNFRRVEHANRAERFVNLSGAQLLC